MVTILPLLPLLMLLVVVARKRMTIPVGLSLL